jgi:acyl-CoA thioesterase I
MYDETLFFMDPPGTRSTLLFVPDRVLSFRNATQEIAFVEGQDYELNRVDGTVTRLPGSRLPFTAPADVSRLTCADDDGFHRRQVTVTYTHPAGAWRGYQPRFAGAAVPETLRHLLSSQPLRIAITGDSISEGYNASAFIRVPPFQPAYGPLVAAGLEQTYGSRIDLHNFAVAGWTSDHGVADVDRVASVNPHLVIIAYGMNDASYAEPLDFAGNVGALVEAVRERTPAAEFVIVSPMLPTLEPDAQVMARFTAYRDALVRECARGVILADVTSLWKELLIRKSPYDLTGNGLNHPNDFGHRLYAQVILARLVDRDRLTAAPAR